VFQVDKMYRIFPIYAVNNALAPDQIGASGWSYWHMVLRQLVAGHVTEATAQG